MIYFMEYKHENVKESLLQIRDSLMPFLSGGCKNDSYTHNILTQSKTSGAQ